MNPEDVKKYGLEEGDWVNVWLLIEEWDLLGRKVKAGELGRKPGPGWYEHHPDGSRPNGNHKEK
jgi:anaerobic selenocysteine-containing dehydrogenase